MNLWLKIHDICIWLWEVRTASGYYCLLSQFSRNYLDLLFILGVNMAMNIFQVKLLNIFLMVQVKLLDIFLMVCSHFRFHKKFTKYLPTSSGPKIISFDPSWISKIWCSSWSISQFVFFFSFFLLSCNHTNFKDDYLLVIWHTTSRLLIFSR